MIIVQATHLSHSGVAARVLAKLTVVLVVCLEVRLLDLKDQGQERPSQSSASLEEVRPTR